MTRWTRTGIRVLAGALLTALVTFGQITGDLQINVSDQTAAAVPNATITVRNTETGAARTAVTDSVGQARVTQLAVGRYEIAVAHAGFSNATQQAQVQSGNVATVPITLQVATAAQQIVVESEATPLNTVNPQLQTTIENTAIRDLPLVATGVLGLAATAPGVTPVTPNNPFLGLGSYNSNGGRGRGNNITLDGATTTDVSTTGAAGLGTVPLDAIRETNIITNQFNAEYGRNANSQFQILTRQGGNDFHGELFEFAANSFFSARNYFDTTGSATPNINNDWGAMAGGHIIKDKLFYFGTYEQTTIRGLGGTRVAIVPTPDQAANAVPIAQQILKQYNVPTSPTGTVSESAPNATDTLAYSGRLDYNVTPNDYFYLRFGELSTHAQSTGLTFIDSALVTNGAGSQNRAWNGTISETHTFSPTVVNTFLGAYGRSAPVFPPLFTGGGPEVIFTDGTSNFGTWSGLPQGRIQNTYQYQDALAVTIGRHQLKFGGGMERIQANSFFDSNVNGSLVFTSLANFLNGVPAQYSQDFGNSVRGNRVWNEFFFLQDDWKVARTLTLNLGFREEIAGGPTEINNILSNINPSLTTQPLGGAGAGPLGSFYTGGSYFHTNWNPGPRFGFAWNPKDGKTVIRGGYGITYDFIYLNPITNGRFLPPFMYTFTLPASGFAGDNTIANILAGASPFQASGHAAVGSFASNITNFGNVSYIDPNLNNPQVQQFSLTVERDLFSRWFVRAGYSGSIGHYLQRTRQLNLVQPGLVPVSNSYADEQANAAQYLKVLAGLNGTSSTQSNRIDPRFNYLSVVESSANSNYNSLQLYAERRFADWYGFSVAYTWSKSIDNASDALGVLANDTPLQQDPRDNANNRAVSQFDIPHRLVITHDFVSSSRAFSSRGLNLALGGWQFTGIFQAQSGYPANFSAGTVAICSGGPPNPANNSCPAGTTLATIPDALLLGAGNASGTGVVRPNQVGPVSVHFAPNPGAGSHNPDLIPGSGLAQPFVGNIGTLGRNVVRLNPLIQADMGFGRIFKIGERASFHFEAQVFNVFNNTTFSSPGLSLSSPTTFGYYSGTDTNSRRVTLTGRLIW
jgi:Carboxypeptidase regulatory-like domain